MINYCLIDKERNVDVNILIKVLVSSHSLLNFSYGYIESCKFRLHDYNIVLLVPLSIKYLKLHFDILSTPFFFAGVDLILSIHKQSALVKLSYILYLYFVFSFKL